MSLKYCFKCAEPVEQTVMVCPACGTESFIHQKPRAESNEEVKEKKSGGTQVHESAYKNFKVGSGANLKRLAEPSEPSEPKGYSSGSYSHQAQTAAVESSKNALTFRNIGVVIQWVGLVLAVLTLASYLYLFPGTYKLLALLVAILVFLPFWLIGSLYRGLASYIRFKSLAYLAEKEK